MTWAYLRSQLFDEAGSWEKALRELSGAAPRLGRIESK
jgi:hypothetical protein